MAAETVGPRLIDAGPDLVVGAAAAEAGGEGGHLFSVYTIWRLGPSLGPVARTQGAGVAARARQKIFSPPGGFSEGVL